MVLAPQNSGTSAGTRVMLVTGNEEDQTQLWSLEDADGSARFINKASGLAIGIANDDMTSGNNLVLTEKSDSSIYQLWNVINKSTSATLEQPDIPNYAGPIEEPSEPADPSDPSDPSEPTETPLSPQIHRGRTQRILSPLHLTVPYRPVTTPA